jgi:hypothetical protein
MFSFIVWAVLILCFITFVANAASKPKKKGRKPNYLVGRTISSDGHTIPYKDDITCETKDGHHHPTSNQPRYIVHEEPEEGYVILNGKKIRLKDCKYL